MSLTLAAIDPARRGERALADERVRLSWAELDPILNRAANGLHGLHFGDRARRVAVFAQNSAETVIAYVAGLEAGVSTTPVSFHLTADEAAYILADSGSSAVFVGPETAEVGLAAAKAAGIATVIGWRCPPRAGLIAWETWLAAASEAPPPGDVRPLPHLHYTSGTTGKPKAAETPPQYFPAAETVTELAEILRARATPSPGLAVGPLYHTGPLTLARSLFAGVALVTMQSFDAEAVLATIEREGIAGSVMVPTHFQRLLALPTEVRAKYDLSSLKRLAHTGAACPREVKRAMIDWLGPVLVEAYGGTEAGSTTFITAAEWLEKPGSVGKALAPYEALILGEDGEELGPDAVGQLYFRDTTGRGIVYHNDPEKTAAAHIRPGVFTLGEVGYKDAEGYVFITDRVSDMVVSGGVNIYPAEVEQALIAHPEVADVVVIGAPNAEMGEEVKALVIAVDPKAPPTPEDLNRFCRDRLAGFKCPRSYEFVSDVGRNAMGKVNKRALKQRYWPTERMIGG
jgi:acyl-CoA synthetase (AMP-forming)/AMP-acid ligase II